MNEPEEAEFEVVDDQGKVSRGPVDLPTDDMRERIRGEYQAARGAAIAQSARWTVEDLVIQLVVQHRREVAAAPYQSLMLETGRLVLELAALRKELLEARLLNDQYRREEKIRRLGRNV